MNFHILRVTPDVLPLFPNCFSSLQQFVFIFSSWILMQQEECVPAGLLNVMHFKTSTTQAAMRHLGGCLPKIQKKKKNQTAIGTRQLWVGRKPRKGPFRGLGLQALGWLQSRVLGIEPKPELFPTVLRSLVPKDLLAVKLANQQFVFRWQVFALKRIRKSRLRDEGEWAEEGARQWLREACWTLFPALRPEKPRQLPSVGQ